MIAGNFVVTANGTNMGFYAADSADEALNIYARDAGYKDYADLITELDDDAEVISADDAIVGMFEGRHDGATKANTAKLAAMWMTGDISRTLYDAVTETFRTGILCMGEGDWEEVEAS